MKFFSFVGARVIKTAVAVFLTALICQWLDWPPVFAVITAIVTIEPTVTDSLKKGMVRFPASAIGSAYSVLFISFFADSALTYAAAAFFTIITCYKLRLYAGLLVATLTSVAMIEVIHSEFFISFFIRLGTTTIGLLTSTMVNMFIFPPNYSKTIAANLSKLSKTAGDILQIISRKISKQQWNKKDPSVDLAIEESFLRFRNELQKTDEFIEFQKEEWKYHRFSEKDKRFFQTEQKKLTTLNLIHYHLENLASTPMKKLTWEKIQSEKVLSTISSLVNVLQNKKQFDLTRHRTEIKEIREHFFANMQPPMAQTYFNPEIVIYYELLSIYNLVERLYTE